ncbi:preprotein translocase subunit SecA [Weissella uvarum]|uniref:preprotein translocase subunit SecA n=1 Tax=Weissella uvarum TaxID=1479233 RepID=UPI001961B372|nr:helicase-related protein [Weissella uvarum]MBM7617861.1 preprotein translocase subunit SecA [Weissella uvarum]MCM0596141.1 hypothetical protein [Weissella uvarum]
MEIINFQTQKTLKKIDKLIDDVYSGCTIEQLRGFLVEVKGYQNRIDRLTHTFAILYVHIKNELGFTPHKVQLQAALEMANGNLIEMKTGEGKTLTALFTALFRVIEGDHVHIITVNDYLAKRDRIECGALLEKLGVSVSLNSSQHDITEKQNAYLADVMYATSEAVGFDYLKDNVWIKDPKNQSGLKFECAIVDEADNIFLDQAVVPLIIGLDDDSTKAADVKAVDMFVSGLRVNDFIVDKASDTTVLTESGIKKAQKRFQSTNLFSDKSTDKYIMHLIVNALSAHFNMQKGHQYVVKNGEIQLVSDKTGRITQGQRYSEGLHVALEAKEKLEIKNDQLTSGSITYEALFNKYKFLTGMSGTMMSSKKEFKDLYHLGVVKIPTNKRIQRKDLATRLFSNRQSKYDAIVAEVKKLSDAGRPVLIGVGNVEESEQIQKVLEQNRIYSYLLNAEKKDMEETIVKLAGRVGSVTVATNMAGRGTDIKIDVVAEAEGGLAVIAADMSSSKRIDDQLKGRAGRQGQPGTSQMFVSLDDEVFDKLESYQFSKFKYKNQRKDNNQGHEITSRIKIHRALGYQKYIESKDVDTRKTSDRFDDIVKGYRDDFYRIRNKVLHDENFQDSFDAFLDQAIDEMLSNQESFDAAYNNASVRGRKWLVKYLRLNNQKPSKAAFSSIHRDAKAELHDLISNYIDRFVDYSVGQQELKDIELNYIDRSWMYLLMKLEVLKQSVQLQAHAQYNPFLKFEELGNELYADAKKYMSLDVFVAILSRVLMEKGYEHV